MTALGVVGLLLGLLGWRIAVVRPTRLRIAVFAAAFLLHAAGAVAFYLYAGTVITDCYAYYYDPLNFSDLGFGLTTQLIYFTVHSLRAWAGGTFLDYFLLFQAPGFIGLCLLMRCLEEIHAELNLEPPWYLYGFLFLPGLHFWTSSIGKDGILFMTAALATWATINIGQRYRWLAVALALMMAIRPHIGLIMAAAVAGALLFDRSLRFHWRMLLLVSALGGLAAAAVTIRTTFQVDVTDADSVSDFLAGFEEVTRESGDAGATAVTGNFVVRLLSLLFRPLFLDASGPLGYVASVENVVLLLVMGTFLWRIRDLWAAARTVVFIRFALLSFIGIALLLTLIYYNVGLGLRQRTMFLPAVIIIYAALFALQRARAAFRPPQLAPAPATP